MIVGLESNSKIFTVYVHGLLELQVNNFWFLNIKKGDGDVIEKDTRSRTDWYKELLLVLIHVHRAALLYITYIHTYY